MGTSIFPSRDELQSLIQNLQDASKTYDDSLTANGTASRGKLIGLAKDLINQLRHPMDTADAHLANANELVAIRTCLHLKVFHSMPPSDSISLDEIAEHTSASSSLLERLLRMLVCTGFLQSPKPYQYAHTKHSYAYTLMPGPGMFFQLTYDESFLMIDNLHVYLSEKGYVEPRDQRYSPYAWKSRQEGTDIWEIMAQHPERFHAFQAGLAHADASIPLLGYYDFAQLGGDASERPIFVDVGGGTGHSIVQILQAHPHLDPSKFILQDLPAVLKKAGENEMLPKQVEIMEHNFFTEQPVKGAKAYFLRRVFHDYSDAVCTDILFNLVSAMAHDSRILIADLMLPESMTANELSLASFDMTMFNMGGKERTEACFRKILKDAGCELVQVWRSEYGFGVIVEARLRGAGERVVDGPVLEPAEPAPVEGADESAEHKPLQNGHVNGSMNSGLLNGESAAAENLSPTPQPGSEVDQSSQPQETTAAISQVSNNQAQIEQTAESQVMNEAEEPASTEQQPAPAFHHTQVDPLDASPPSNIEQQIPHTPSTTAPPGMPTDVGASGLHSTDLSATTISPSDTVQESSGADVTNPTASIGLPDISPQPSPGPIEDNERAAESDVQQAPTNTGEVAVAVGAEDGAVREARD